MPYKPSPSEPIAVVASSCRFTGGATSPSKLWDLLREPRDLARPVPASRFNIKAFYHPEGDYHGTTDATKAYWLDDDQDPRAFDAGFFGIAPKEAEAVDPQQRLLLETVYEAIESAGYTLPEWTGQNVAVYVGAMTSDFDSMSQRDDLTTSPYYATGNARSILSNRISYFFDFHGPSATIDTACSSSLVALHQAVLSLRAGDCSAACVAGVNLMLAPEQFVVESSLHMLSPTGHCHMWDKRADGYARGEGAAVLLLKPLSRALADGDASRIQAIVRETGVGSDGRTSGITMPSPQAQAALIRATYRRAGLDLAEPADRCQYFEAHGTGTPVGDPREAKAIHSAFFGGDNDETAASPRRASACETLLVGSIKTVVGHTEGAAGVAGVLKVILAMKHAQVPPNLHMHELSPTVAPFCTPSASSRGYLKVASQLQSWPAVPDGQPMRASVNSFGFGGTNAHAIVEHFDPAIHTHASETVAAAAPPSRRSVVSLPHIPLMLSATSSNSLRTLAQRYLEYLKTLESTNSPMSLQEVAWLVAASRTTFIQRVAINASDRIAAIASLSCLLSSDTASGPVVREFGVRARRTEEAPLRLVGIFTGQGAQWAGMSRHLFATSRVYRDCIASLDAVLQACPHPPAWSLEAELQKLDAAGSRVKEAAISQPLCTAVQVGLVAILARLGLRFACVVGHSSGEIGAAHAAGRLSARDAILIAYYRGLSMMAHPATARRRRPGGMLAAGMASAEAVAFCRKFGGGALCVAASNSPKSTTLSGDVEAVELAQRMLERDGIFARRLVVDRAYHSHHMASFTDTYAGYLATCQINPLDAGDDDGKTPVWISSVYPGGEAPTKTQLASQYWVDNMTKPVLFREAIEAALSLPILKDGVDAAIEVGPHSTLKGPFLDTVAAAARASTAATAPSCKSSLPYKSLLRRGQRDDLVLQDFIGFMATHFDPSPISVQGLLDAEERALLDTRLARLHRDDSSQKLPAYAWDHSQMYYRQSRIARQFHHQSAAPHELLGARTRDDVDGCELRWRNLLRVDKLPWLAHHSFQGQPLFPASAYCIMALDAAKALLAGRPASRIELEDVQYVGGTPLEVDGGPATEIMFSLTVQSPAKMVVTPSQVGGAGTRREDDTIEAHFSIYAAPEASAVPMSRRCSGRIRMVLGTPDKDALPHRMDPREQPETFPVAIDAFYDMMAGVGLAYSGPFQAIASMRRRNDFASASLPRFHGADTTGLAISPATLDACLQTCFATFSSPGDKALWTAFLPIHMKKIVFSMAHESVAGAAGPKRSPSCSPKDGGGGRRLHVDAELTHFEAATHDHPSRITGDVFVYNDAGDMEVQVEGLTVGSFASPKPSADRELYLHTVYATDPEYALAGGNESWNTDGDDSVDGVGVGDIDDRVLEESCERVAAFKHPSSAWPTETEETLRQHILTSPYARTLRRIRELAPLDIADQACQAIIAEGQQASRFQRQMARVVKQIGHRYARMSVFSLTEASMCLSPWILRGLGASFASYTSAVVGGGDDDPGLSAHVQQPEHVAHKVHMVALAQPQEIKAALATNAAITEQPPFDLVIVSTSVFKQQLQPSETVLSRIKELMRPGAFLILVHMPIHHHRGHRGSRMAIADDAMITPPDWPDLLEQTGFMHPAAILNTDQHYPGGFSMTVRQCDSPFKKRIASGGGSVSDERVRLDEKLLIIAGSTAETVSLAAATGHLLSRHLQKDATIVYGLDDLAALPPTSLSLFTAAIVLADLDDHRPILSTLDDTRLGALRDLLLLPDLTVLWVTKGARNGNAENAASYGFTRSVRAEMPSLTLQMLDFDSLEMVDGQLRAPGPSPRRSSISPHKPLAASTIASHFLQLLHGTKQREVYTKQPRRHGTEAPSPSHLWVLETELFIGPSGERLIPRLVPFQPGNDSYNAARRVVTTPVNTLSTCVEIVHSPLSTYTTRLGPSVASLVESAHHHDTDTDSALLVRVLYSTPDALFDGHCLCIGRDELHGNVVATMSRTSASFVSVPRAHAVSLSHSMALSVRSLCDYASILAKMLLGQAICQHVGSQTTTIVLIGPDSLLLQCANIAAAASGHTIVSVHLSTSKPRRTDSSTVYIHPRATQAQMRSALQRIEGRTTAFVDFLPPGNAIANHVRTYLAADCTYQSWNEIGRHPHAEEAWRLLQQAVASTNAHLTQLAPALHAPEPISVAALLKGSAHPVPPPSPRIVDWRADRVVPHTEQPLLQTFRADRTYVLVGITRDMGQSLASLFVRQGARHVVLASRSTRSIAPATQTPQWAKRLQTRYGAVVRFAALDVTDLAAVRAFRSAVERDMPPVAGIVNGAMVLDDRVFTHMTAATFARVMQPKAVGSWNLDVVFGDDHQLDFFIMTSSFAAPGGHAGQSNYAAANMYMNGLAARRQRRGQAGSVLNIGVIYGLGFLHRERGTLYAGLEREGYPPISERDLHHMFLEAIRQGRGQGHRHPMCTRPIVDLTTGLSRYDPDQSSDSALHWHNDPRFSHFTCRSSSTAAADATQADSAGQCKGAANSATKKLTDMISQAAAPVEVVGEQLAAALIERLSSLLHLDSGSGGRNSSSSSSSVVVRGDSSLAELGVDSLVAVETRTWLWRTTGQDVPVMRILGAPSINKLCMDIGQAIVASYEGK